MAASEALPARHRVGDAICTSVFPAVSEAAAGPEASGEPDAEADCGALPLSDGEPPVPVPAPDSEVVGDAVAELRAEAEGRCELVRRGAPIELCETAQVAVAPLLRDSARGSGAPPPLQMRRGCGSPAGKVSRGRLVTHAGSQWAAG